VESFLRYRLSRTAHASLQDSSANIWHKTLGLVGVYKIKSRMCQWKGECMEGGMYGMAAGSSHVSHA
jgi:hypothetical protein